MLTRNTRTYSLLLVILDFVAITAVFAISYTVRVHYDPRPLIVPVYALDYALTFLLISPFWILIFALLGLYKSSTYSRRLIEWSKIAVGVVIGILFVIGWEYVSEERLFPARLVAVYALAGSFIAIVFGRELLRLVRSVLISYGWGINRVLVIGNTHTTRDIVESLTNTYRTGGYEVVAIAGPRRAVPKDSQAAHYARVETALKNIDTHAVTTIIQTDLYSSSQRNQLILQAAQENHIAYSFIPGEPEFYAGKNDIDVFLGYPMISVSQTPLIGWGAIFKRIFDASLVVLSSPFWLTLLAVLIILQKIFNPGPAFFTSTRVGRHGNQIQVYKLRSMKPEYSGQDAIKIFKKMGRHDLADEYAKARKIANDPRITLFGKFLRATSLDEIPQIINVIKGDMSIVGPRPILPDEKHFYKNRGALLFSVRPGITGLWQVSGRSDMSFEGRVDLELYYAQNWSFWLDMRILFKTLSVVVFGKGAQ